MKVVLAPFPVSWDLGQNVSHIEAALASCQPDELVVFPEGALSGYSDDLSGLARLHRTTLVQALDHVHKVSGGRGVYVVLGTLWPNSGRWTNSAVVLDPQGDRWWYDKVNLAYHERGVLAFGQRLSVRPGPPARIGVQLCRDLRFPEQWRWLSQEGAEVLVYLTHAVSNPEDYPVWKSHLVSRAAENQRFVVAVNTASPNAMCPSMVVNPKGHVLAEARPGETTLLKVSFNLDQVSNWYLSQARVDLLRLDGRGSLASE